MSSLKLKKKIDSPLAKYNNAGQLYCVLCNAPVKNEMYWTGHVNGKAHKESITALKLSKSSNGKPSTQSNPPPQDPEFKRPAPVAPQSPLKRPAPDNDAPPRPKAPRLEESLLQAASLPPQTSEPEQDTEDSVPDPPPQQAIPQGFFDDPKEDAKARGVKFKDPQDAEWDRFVKEMATEDLKSTEIQVIDQEASAAGRELDQIEEQMAAWQRVIDLEKRAESWKSKSTPSQKMDTTETATSDVDEDDDMEYTEDLDWRNKKR